MYQYTDFDKQFVRQRAAQFRDQLTRNLAGELGDEEFRPLRLQNGWYIQRHAPMARIAVPYGEINSAQLRMLARIAREYDRPDPELLAHAQRTQDALQASQPGMTLAAPPLRYGYGHFTTRTNVQFNWIPLTKAADVMALLREAAESGAQVVIGYVGNDGTVGERTVTPERVDGGRLTAFDERADASLTFALHRITAVSP